MDDKLRKPHWLAAGSRIVCLAVIVLLAALYFGSYRLLLVDESQEQMSIVCSSGDLILVPPTPAPAYGEKYRVGGEGVRTFYWPANRLHRVVLRMVP